MVAGETYGPWLLTLIGGSGGSGASGWWDGGHSVSVVPVPVVAVVVPLVVADGNGSIVIGTGVKILADGGIFLTQIMPMILMAGAEVMVVVDRWSDSTICQQYH